MKRIRIGKDISMRWEITTDGVAIPLEGRDLTIEIKSPAGIENNIPYRVEGNILIMTYYGYEQNRPGEYSITLWEKKGKPGQNVVDVIRAFELVRTSQEENDFVGGDLQIESVDLGTENFDILTEGGYRAINIDTLQAEALKDSVNINGKTYSNESFTLTLPKVNLDSAGVMSADDKQTLQEHGNRIAQINTILDEHTEGINANITTDRIEDGAVTSDKISTSAFDNTLSVSGKIAPADVVGEIIATKVDKEEGKSLIDSEYASTKYSIENPELLEATIDSEGKLLAGRTSDGEAFENVGLSTPKISIDGSTLENVENPEWVKVVTDEDGKILYGIKTDGKLYFGDGCPPQVKDYIEEKILSLSLDEYEDIVTFVNDYLGSDTTLKAIIDGIITTKVNKEEGKSLIDSEYASTKSNIDNIEFLEVVTDSDNRVLYGVKKDGSFYLPNIPNSIKEGIQENRDYIDSKIQGTLSLKPSSFVTSLMTSPTDIQPLELHENLTEVQVSTESELISAINRYTAGENIAVVLMSDIKIGNTIRITKNTEGGECSIIGNGHSLYKVDNSYNKIGIKNNKSFGTFNGSIQDINVFVSDSGDILSLSQSDFFEAKSRVTDEDGNTFEEQTGGEGSKKGKVYKFLLPEEFDGVSVSENDNVFINFTQAWTASTCKVIKIEYNEATTKSVAGTYLYFRYDTDISSYNVDYDYVTSKNSTSGALFTSFFLLNYPNNDNNGILVRNNEIYFPLKYKSVNHTIDTIIEVVNNKGIVSFSDIMFKGGAYAIKSTDSKIKIENCVFDGQTYTSVEGVRGTTNCDNNKFINLYGNAISNIAGILYATYNIIKNTGLKRFNKGMIQSSGHYYIAYNHIEDYGYMGIGAGIGEMTSYTESYGIIEHNTLKQSREYLYKTKHKVVSDGGVIYLWCNNNPYVIVRYNKIINGHGRSARVGIYLDDGCYNAYVLGNIVENVPSYALYARYASNRNTAGLPDNVNRIIAHNICDEAVKLEGNPNVADNGCYLGYNLFTNKCRNEDIINNVMGQEPQIHSIRVSIENGIVKTPCSLKNWSILNT